MLAMGIATPNMKAVEEGKVAGKMAFDIIDRAPSIQEDTGNNKGENI